MMALVFSILKILGFVLIAALVVTFILLLFVLFSTIRAELDANSKDSPFAKADFKWLFGLVRLYAAFTGDNIEYNIEYPLKSFLTGNRKGKGKKRGKAKNKKPKEQIRPAAVHTEENGHEDKKTVEKASEEPTGKEAYYSEEPDFKYKEPTLIDKISEKIAFLESVENKKAIFDCFIKNAGFLISHIKLGVKRLRLLFGFEDPSLTGKVLGVIYSLGIPFFEGTDINADFDKAVFEADINITGSTNLFCVLLPVLRFILNKNVRKYLF